MEQHTRKARLQRILEPVLDHLVDYLEIAGVEDDPRRVAVREPDQDFALVGLHQITPAPVSNWRAMMSFCNSEAPS